MAETQDLDMGVHRVINLGNGIALQDAVTMFQFLDVTNTINVKLSNLLSYYIRGAIETVPAASAIILRSVAPCNFRLSAGAGLHVATADTLATGTATFLIKKNGTNIGTMTFTNASNLGVFSITSDTNFLPGDVLTIIAPASPDATLQHIGITLVGTLY